MKIKYLLIILAVIVVTFLFMVLRPFGGALPSPSLTSTPTSTPTPTARQTTTPAPAQIILMNVPFTSQAPTGNWSDPRQQDGCEEASALMAMYWVRSDTLSTAVAEEKILAIADFEQEVYGSYRDTNAQDTVDRIFIAYFGYENVRAQDNPTSEDIISELEKGNLVITPMNGRKLNNPHYTPPGPERHMLVIVGYDPVEKEFITNDPGTRFGRSYRYPVSSFMEAILNYPTGDHVPLTGNPKAMIVVSK